MRKRSLGLLLFILLIIGMATSLMIGTIPITVNDLLELLTGAQESAKKLVVVDFRMPRMLISIFAGAGLAVSGYLFQMITHNDLADPGMLGINAGTGLTVLLYLGFLSNQSENGFLPLIACGGSFFSAFLVYFCGKQRAKFDPNRLLLAGVAVNAGISALTLLGTISVSKESYHFVTSWLAGTIWGSTWQHVLMIVPGICLLLPLVLLQGKTLEVIELGDEQAISLGVALKRKQLFFLCCAVILAAISVAVAGSISFIGLIAPHIAKTIVKRKNNQTLLLSALVGSLLLLYSDILGRVVLAEGEVAAGIVVSLVGAPYFVYRLLKK